MPFGDIPLGARGALQGPLGTYLAAPTGGVGEDTGFETPGQQPNTFQYRGGPVRVVDGKGKVLFSGEGPEGALAAAQFAQNLSDTKGKNATWDLQEGERTINPDGSVGPIRYVSGPSTRAKGMGAIGDLAAFALPIAAAIATGGASLGAQIAASAAAGGIGGVLSGNNPLKSALLSGATAGIMGGTGANAAIGKAVGNVGGVLAGKTAEELTKTAAEKAAEQIVVTGLSKAAQGAGSAIGNTLLSQAAKGTLVAPQPTPEAVQPPLDNTIVVSADRLASGSGLPFGAAFPVPVEALLSGALTAAQPTPAEQPTAAQPEDIVVTGSQPPVIPTEAIAAVPIAGGLLAATGGGSPSVINGIDQATGDIVVNAPQTVAAPAPIAGFETAIPAAIGGALTAAQTAGTPPSTKDGVLGTGLNIPQLLSLGGVGADLLKNLLAGGDGAGAGTPYVSPFGTGVGFAPGQDMRANPTIMDYERYGFGPEAMFFQPGYGLLSAGAAPQAQPIMAVPQAQPAMMTNPRYEPLI